MTTIFDDLVRARAATPLYDELRRARRLATAFPRPREQATSHPVAPAPAAPVRHLDGARSRRAARTARTLVVGAS